MSGTNIALVWPWEELFWIHMARIRSSSWRRIPGFLFETALQGFKVELQGIISKKCVSVLLGIPTACTQIHIALKEIECGVNGLLLDAEKPEISVRLNPSAAGMFCGCSCNTSCSFSFSFHGFCFRCRTPLHPSHPHAFSMVQYSLA